MGLLLASIEDPDPVIFLEPIRLYRAVKEEVPAGRHVVRIGEASVVSEGTDVTVVSWGAMMREVRQTAELLAAEDISVEVIDLRSLVPLDSDRLVESVSKTGRAVVVHEAPRTGGFGAEVTAQIQERCLYELAAPVARVTGWDTIVPLKRTEHHYLPDPERIARAVRATLEA